MSVADRIIETFRDRVTHIEHREGLRDDEKVSQIINLFAAVCAGFAIQPIPFADIYILTPIQAYMGSRIAAIRGVPVTRSGAAAVVREIAGVIGLGLLAQQLAIGAYKTFIPFLGAVTTIPMVFGLTYGIGRVMDAYFIHKARGQHLSPEAMKDIWRRGRKEGEKASDQKAAKEVGEQIRQRVAEPTVRFVRTNLDEVAILASLEMIRGGHVLADVDQAVLAALSRTTPRIESPDDARAYVQELSPEQIDGVVASVKGVLHEMEFVRLENSDGDDVTAAMFTEPNHPGYDVLLTNNETGEIVEVQLKSTDNQGYIEEWVADHPDGEILVTEEAASAMGLPSSGFLNEELTVRVEEFVDGLLSPATDDSLWMLLPGLSVLSVSFVVMELHRRYRAGELSADEFKHSAARATGLKVTKVAMLLALLSVPVVNVAVGAALVAKLILSAHHAFFSLDSSSAKKTLPRLSKQTLLSRREVPSV